MDGATGSRSRAIGAGRGEQEGEKLKEEIKGNCHLDWVAFLLQFLDTHPHSSEEQHREAESESRSQQSSSTFKT